MNSFISDIERDFELFKFSKSEYDYKLQELAQKLNLKNGFKSDSLPSYFVGNIESKDKIIVIGINPGAEEINLEFESKIRDENWNSYLNFHKNFFIEYKKGPPIKYYSYLRTCFDSYPIETEHYFDYCNNNFVNIDLIPYHSTNFNVILNEGIEKIYMEYFQSIIDFLKEKRDLVRYIVIHKNQLVKLLVKEKFFDESNRLPMDINPKRKVYYKKVDGFNFLFFSRFIPNGGFSREDIQKVLHHPKVGG
jgi:hypothetical protein